MMTWKSREHKNCLRRAVAKCQEINHHVCVCPPLSLQYADCMSASACIYTSGQITVTQKSGNSALRRGRTVLCCVGFGSAL